MDFEEFVASTEEKLRAGLVASYGPDVGNEATAEALAYAWADWDRIQTMTNPVGYLYRVGQSSSRKYVRPRTFLPDRPPPGLPQFEPGLAPALQELSEPQRVAVVLVHALGWSLRETADVLDVTVSTVRTHIQRGMTKLRTALQVNDHVS